MVSGMELFIKLQQKSNHIRIMLHCFFRQPVRDVLTVANFTQGTLKNQVE